MFIVTSTKKGADKRKFLMAALPRKRRFMWTYNVYDALLFNSITEAQEIALIHPSFAIYMIGRDSSEFHLVCKRAHVFDFSS